MTDQLLHQRISREKYLDAADEFRCQLSDQNIAQESDAGEDATTIRQRGSIQYVEEEYVFFLFRHWNLFESMFNSRHIAARLEVWKDVGRRQLNLMLAKVGIPLKEGRAPFLFMAKNSKERLREKLLTQAPAFHLKADELCFPSFTRVGDLQDCYLHLLYADCRYLIAILFRYGNVCIRYGVHSLWIA